MATSVWNLTGTFGAGTARDPLPQKKSWNPVGEDAIEGVGNGVGSSVDKEKDMDAEGDGEESDDPSGNGDWTIDRAEGLEPGHGGLHGGLRREPVYPNKPMGYFRNLKGYAGRDDPKVDGPYTL